MKALAVKYRPKYFVDVVEQEHIKVILEQQIKSKNHRNCYLFTGGAGTGKTTCARIFADMLNGFKGSPIEIDGASNNGVENVRQIIADARFKSVDSDYKVYIIDECHMFSTGAWNAMLKLIEEPPASTVFIFCTTDPQKIPNTILSRVQRYDFRRISYQGIIDRLDYICRAEGMEIDEESEAITDVIDREPEALEYIAKLVDGGLRDAIMLLDKALSFSTSLTLENVVKALGVVNYDDLFELMEAVISGDYDKTINIIEDVHRNGLDLKQFIKQFLTFCLDILKFKITGSFDFIYIPSNYETRLQDLYKDSVDYHYILDTILKLNSDIKWSSAAKALIESTFILLIGEINK